MPTAQSCGSGFILEKKRKPKSCKYYMDWNFKQAMMSGQCRILLSFANTTGCFASILDFKCLLMICCFMFSHILLPTSVNRSSDGRFRRYRHEQSSGI